MIKLQEQLDWDIQVDRKFDKLSKEGNPYAFDFPKAKIEDAPYDFSFSGVKSAVLNHLNKCKMAGGRDCSSRYCSLFSALCG